MLVLSSHMSRFEPEAGEYWKIVGVEADAVEPDVFIVVEVIEVKDEVDDVFTVRVHDVSNDPGLDDVNVGKVLNFERMFFHERVDREEV